MSDEVCRCCGGTGLATAPVDPVETLRRWLVERGHWISPTDEIRTEAASDALGCSTQWLNTQACYFNDRLPSRRCGRYRLYPIAAIAARLAGELEV